MVAVNTIIDDCEFCDELRQDGVVFTGSGSEGFSRIIERQDGLAAMVGLGAIVPGYLLVLPEAHLRSFGELEPDELRSALVAVDRLARRVEAVFGRRCLLVEHGSSGERPQGACVDHAHIHILPIPNASDGSSFVPTGCESAEAVEVLRSLASERRSYFAVRPPDEGWFVMADPGMKSQWARRRWAEALGRPEEWDWALSPNLPNILETVDALVGSHQPLIAPVPVEDSSSEGSSDDWNWERFYEVGHVVHPSAFGNEAAARFVEADVVGVIDLACGNGRDSLEFLRRGLKVLAVDSSAEALGLLKDGLESSAARGGNGPEIHTLRGDLLAEPVWTSIAQFREGVRGQCAFYCRFFVHQIPSEDLQRLLDLLTQNVMTGDLLGLEFRSSEDRDAHKDRPHQRYFYSAGEVVEALEVRGFAVELINTGFGLAPFQSEDPHVVRLYARFSGFS